MIKFTHNDFVVLLLQLSTILFLSKIIGELSKKINIPVVIGELVLGIILGPTVLETIFPSFATMFFPDSNALKIAFDSFVSIAIVIFLFTAGLEIHLSLLKNIGKNIIYISITSTIIPFLLGFGAVYLMPDFFGISPSNIFTYALFFGSSMSISALPVIIRILIDLDMLKTRIGVIVTACVIIIDIVTWIIFSMTLGLINDSEAHINPLYTIITIILFVVFSLSTGLKLNKMFVELINKKFPSTGNNLAYALSICFLAASFTEFIGTHAILGAFIAGVVFGNTNNFNEKSQNIIHHFASDIFAPIFFVSIGLKVNFITNFDFIIVGFVLLLGYISKISGTYIGAYLSNMSHRDSLSVSFAMNARGGMEIILGSIALNAKLIDEKMFVALVVMALLSSITSAPMMKALEEKVRG